MVWKMWIICCCTVLAPFGFVFSADGPASYSREDIQKYAPTLTLQLRSTTASERDKAVEIVRKIAETSARILSDNLVQWTDPLIENGKYDEVLKFSDIAIADRSFDVTTVEKLQEARVRAWMGLNKLDQALIDAKSYYNVCILSNMPYSIDILSNILERQGKSPVASRLHFEQTRTPATQPASSPLVPVSQIEGLGEGSDTTFENGLPLNATVLTSIKIDPLIWQNAMDRAGGHSYNNAMSRGNIDLLMDKPDAARKEFEAAVELSDNSTSSKNAREAVEGVARAIRAKEGSAEPANAFILAVRQDPSKVILAKVDPEKVKEVARQIVLSSSTRMSAPEMEQQRAERENGSRDPKPTRVDVVSNFEGASNLRFQHVSGTHLKILLLPQNPTFCDWFLFRVDGAAGQTLRFDITTSQAPLDKWWTLNPVWCDAKDYARPDMPSKNVASVFLQSQTNTTEVNDSSSVIPDTTGQSWHYIRDVWRSDAQTFSFVQSFAGDEVYIAMRAPYLPSHNEAFLRNLASSNSAVKLVQVGMSRQRRPLLLTQIGSADHRTAPCILLYAGEHADEQDGMWAARGAIEFLASDDSIARQLREHFTFLIIPQLDPDSSARAIHEGINTTFLSEVKTPESIAYANWFQGWVDAGNRLDLVFDLHNMQSSEMGQVQCWLMEGLGDRGERAIAVHQEVLKNLFSGGFDIPSTPVQRGWSPDRLGGWLARRFGPLSHLYELNTQAAPRHLTLAETKLIGRIFMQSAAAALSGEAGRKLMGNVDARRQERLVRLTQNSATTKATDAIQFEAEISKGVGINPDGKPNQQVEKWIP